MSWKSSSVHLLDLNQDVIHEIFGYLERRHLYFCVRNVCVEMKQHVDSFMPLTAKFIPSELIYYDLLRYNQKFASIAYIFKERSQARLLDRKANTSKSSPILTNNSFETVAWSDFIGFFGGTIKGKSVVGYYCFERIINTQSPSLWKRLNTARMVGRKFTRLVPYLYEYDELNNTWKSIMPHKQKQNKYLEYNHRIECGLSYCKKGDSIMVGLSMNSCHKWNSVHSSHSPIYGWMEYKIVQFKFHVQKESSNFFLQDGRKLRLNYSMRLFTIPCPIKGEKCYYTVNLTAVCEANDRNKSEKAYLHGYTIINGVSHFFYSKFHSRPCKLVKSHEKIRYHSLSQRDHQKKTISFKLKGNIYIIGLFETFHYPGTYDEFNFKSGNWRTPSKNYWRCDMYKIDEDTYYESAHSMPPLIHFIYSVMIDLNELYAMIRTDRGIIWFTEDNGFKHDKDCIGIFPEYSFINRSRLSLTSFHFDYETYNSFIIEDDSL